MQVSWCCNTNYPNSRICFSQDYIKVADSSLTFTLHLDGTQVISSCWRWITLSSRWLAISNVTTNTFDINVGSSSYTGAHTFVSATTNGIDRCDGTFTINVGAPCWSAICTHICKCYR